MMIALLVKKGKPEVDKVIGYLKANFPEVAVFEGTPGDPFPERLSGISPHMLISYISPWIVPKSILRRTERWNINFHPGPPEYPGIGCFNFALYNGEKRYGVTAHIMEPKVDTGRVIAVKRFEVGADESVYSLSLKSYESMAGLFYEVMDFIKERKELPQSPERWKRKPYTRAELEELCRIDMNMGEEETGRRVKATTYPDKPGPYIEAWGRRFEYNPDR